MSAFVKTLTGLVFPISVEGDYQMSKIKSIVVPLMNAKTTLRVTEELVRLIYEGAVLKDSDTIDSLGISNGATIHLCRKVFAVSIEELQQYERLERSQALNTGKAFQQLKPGLCFTSVCNDSGCISGGKVILVAKGFGRFDLKEHIRNLKCPACNSYSAREATSALFHKAKWRMIAFTNQGKKQTEWSFANASSYKELSGLGPAGWKTVEVEVAGLAAEDLELDICFRPLCREVGKGATTDFPCVLSISSPPELTGQGSANIICVIDESGSMHEGKISKVKESLTVMVKKIPEGTRVALVSFESSAGIKCSLTADKNKLLKVISTLRGRGMTNITAGIRKALEVLNSVPGRESSSIILLSDGYDPKAIESGDVINKYRENSGKAFTLHTLGYGDEHDVRMMSNLADYGKGTYTSVRYPNQMMDAMALFIGNAISKFARAVNVSFLPNPDVQVQTVYGKPNTESFEVSDLSFDNCKDIVFKIAFPAHSLGTIVPLKATVSYIQALIPESSTRTSEVSLTLRCVEDSKAKDDDSVLEELDRVEASTSIGEACRLASASNFSGAISVLDAKIASIERRRTEKRSKIIHVLNQAKEKVTGAQAWSAGGAGILEDLEKNLMNQIASVNMKLFINNTQLSLMGEQQHEQD